MINIKEALNKILNKKLNGLQVMVIGILILAFGIIIISKSTNEKDIGYGVITIIGGAWLFLWPIIIVLAFRKPKHLKQI